ncbi:MAG: hypothetical protein KKA62_00480 [Nanoarchaeota archaeon]|nr:hypothetical protein [Nanoarchaeota archaeon]MBU1644519.1 hypothetical protein [Nanoarchaeota archaeon]MBU1976412.1 hypothetical protein [Nanoarchaeota archaeon]
MKNLQVAVEYEKGLHRLDGFIANKAEEFRNHPLNQNEEGDYKYFHSEASTHQNEYNSPPRRSLDKLCRDILEAEEISDRICRDLEVINIPISETGAGESYLNPKAFNRYVGYKTIFGSEAVERLTKISGVHIHIDQYKPRLADQFNLLTALRPTIAFTSTSSINHERKNSESCHRYKLFADPKEGVFANIPENRDYIISEKDLKKRDKARYQSWEKVFNAERWRSEVPADYNFTDFFKEFNTGYSDVRLRPDVGEGTFELRINDSAPLDILLGQASLVSGYINRVMRNNIPVFIAAENESYEFSKDRVILPNKETLDNYSLLAVRYGLENKKVQDYLSALENFARSGLEQNERHYLNPLREMTITGKNVASQVIEYLGHKSEYNVEESTQVNLFVHRLHQQAVENLQQKLDYQR